MKKSDAVKKLDQAIYDWEMNMDLRKSLATHLIEIATEELGFGIPKIRVKFDLEKPDGSTQKSYSMIRRWENE